MAHLLRELSFVVESNNYRWAHLLKALLPEACRQLNRRQSKVLSAAACQALRQRYRTILTQAATELPEIPPRSQGRRGRIAKYDTHDLHERLVQHEESVLCFLHDEHVSSTKQCRRVHTQDGQGENQVSGSFRTQAYGEAYARTSSYLQSMAALGCNPLVAIQIALADQAADMVKQHDGPTPPGSE